MLRIYLLRHARAVWAEPGTRDFDRALDARGREDARALGIEMAAKDLRPDRVICSSAKRCRETWDLVAEALPISDVTFTEALYVEDQAAYLDIIRDIEGTGSVMLVGHNPMMEDTATALLEDDGRKASAELRRGFPTCGLAIIDLTEVSPDLPARKASLHAFLKPVEA
ncbi:histidine phosphatase family protein [Rhizobium sp. EC-SD404]|uniref:SixA phosphatase family protein n=1 Tax=Rhizobium sp. EC-SD404 TaxID=2038389 RepID=UPI001258BC7A|nr:histidine phosphatase family protein [Rhizobium sp. EC-SD404]VVT22867.1 Phosphohistidine phosphatase [Rhizobium sp. EC-SD404]